MSLTHFSLPETVSRMSKKHKIIVPNRKWRLGKWWERHYKEGGKWTTTFSSSFQMNHIHLVWWMLRFY